MNNVVDRAVAETHSDRILQLDRIQSTKDGVVCSHNPDHGRLGVTRGAVLICTVKGCKQVPLQPTNI